MENRLIIGLGEVVWDCYPKENYYRMMLGGAPANFSYHSHALGFEAAIISAVGNDYWGEKTIRDLAGKGLKVIAPKVPYETGIVDVIVQNNGNDYDIRKGAAWDNMVETAEIIEAVSHAQAICFGSLAQRSETSRRTILHLLSEVAPKDCMIIFDANLRQHYYTKDIIEQSLKLCNVFKLNAGDKDNHGKKKDGEIDIIGKLLSYPEEDPIIRCHRFIEQFNLDVVLYTCGGEGSYVITPDKVFPITPDDVKKKHIKVVNTTGAGDSFTAAFCSARLKGKSCEEAHKLAFDISSYVCTQEEAMPPIPQEYHV